MEQLLRSAFVPEKERVVFHSHPSSQKKALFMTTYTHVVTLLASFLNIRSTLKLLSGLLDIDVDICALHRPTMGMSSTTP